MCQYDNVGSIYYCGHIIEIFTQVIIKDNTGYSIVLLCLSHKRNVNTTVFCAILGCDFSCIAYCSDNALYNKLVTRDISELIIC